ncbi:hypothetical protein VII00023_19049, partial [Vibrio ichthyoenteri ATCC 700023]
NDSDIDNDTIRITYVYGETQGEAYIKDGMIYFELNETFVGNTTFEYQITDDKGGFDSATVNVIVNPAPNDAIVNEVQLLSNSVEEGNDLAFKVTLDSSALKETTLDIDFGLLGDEAGESDVDLSDLTFTNGVTYDQESGKITVPVGVKDFTVLVPTEKDGLHELDESYSLQVGGVQGVSATGTIENVDVATLSVVSEGNVSEGSAASFKVSLSVPSSESTELSITTNVSGDNNTAEENDLDGSMKAYFLDDNDEPVELTITDGKVMVPPFITEIFVSVGTQDNAIFEGSEQFELIVSNEDGVTSNQSASAATNIVDDGSVDPDGDGAQLADDDRPVVESISAPIVDEGLDAKFDVKLTNTSESVTPITMSLVDDSAHGGSDYTTTQVTVTYHKNGVEVSETLDVNNGSFTFELPADNDGFTVTVATLDDQYNPVFEGNEHFELIVSTESQQDVTSGQATIQDYQDNPPQSEDFEVNVGSNGKTQVIFDTANTPIDDGSNPDSDHISDREDDVDNATDLKIVITELPEDGKLFYKEGDEFLRSPLNIFTQVKVIQTIPSLIQILFTINRMRILKAFL